MLRRKGVYKKEYIARMFDSCSDVGSLYDAMIPLPDGSGRKSKLLNIVSGVSDGERNIEDFLAEKILALKDSNGNGIKELLKNHFESNPVKIRGAGYNPMHDSAKISFNSNSIRRENNIVRLLYKEKAKLNGESTIKNAIGEIIDYEIPLSEGKKNNIDMLAKTNDHINIVEWKTDSASCSDSLLRAVMEITTYEYELNKRKLLEDFRLDEEGYDENSFKKIVAIFDGTKPAITYKNIRGNGFGNIAKLIEYLDINVVVLSRNSVVDKITNDTTIEECDIKLAY